MSFIILKVTRYKIAKILYVYIAINDFKVLINRLKNLNDYLAK